MSEQQSQGLKALISIAQIQQIRLAESSATSKSSMATPASFTVRVEHSASVKEKRDDGTFIALATIDTKLFSPTTSASDTTEDAAAADEQVDAYASVRATFEVRYSLPETFIAESKDLDEFARVNVIFNAWPYFREFVQSTFARMLLGPVVLPLLRIESRPAEEAESKR
jgi:hypothetical protein